PSLALRFSIFIGGLAEDMRMALDELGGDCLSHVVEIEAAFFFGHARMKDDLEQKVAQFIAQRLAVFPLNRVIDLIGFLDGVGSDRLEGLLDIPWTADLRIAKSGHHFKKPMDGGAVC